MTHDSGQSSDELLELYLDGLLEDDARLAFEQRCDKEPALREAVRLQREIDARIRREYTHPADTGMDQMLRPFLPSTPGGPAEALAANRRDVEIGPLPTPGRRSADSRPRHGRPRWRIVAGIAAALAASVWAGFQLYKSARPAAPAIPTYVVGPKRDMLAVYREEIEKGFKPEWVCRNEKEFRESFKGRFGQALAFTSLPKNVCPQGLSYENILSTFTMHLLVRVDDQAVVVFADRLKRDESQALPPESGLHLHRRTIGNLVLYELSPFLEPRVLPYFFDPDAASE